MIFVIALIVCITAISLMFMEEFFQIYKKIRTIPGVILLAPLLFASWIVETKEAWMVWLGWNCQNESRILLEQISAVFPFQAAALHIIKIISLWLFAFLPMFIIWGIERYKGRYGLPRISIYISIVAWIIGVFLII